MAAPETAPPAAVAQPSGPGAAPEAGEVAQRNAGLLTFSAFLHNRRAMTGVWTVVLITLFCFVGPLIYRTNQVTVNLNIANMPPGHGHPLGTDPYGFDVLGRLMTGGQSSLELGFAVAIASTVVGCLYGAISGLIGGVADAVMMRVVDTLLSVPTLVLLLIIASMFTLNLWMIIVLLSLLSWTGVSRLVRAEVLSLRTREFVLAARMMGGTSWRLLARHLVPNTVGVCIVTATFTVADSIYYLSALSFLGLGMPPPAADWGTMLTNGINDLFDSYWWTVYPPAIILVVTVLAFNLIGDGVRDSLDVRLRRRGQVR
jgi:peptide/nickel transport system permease protein